MIDPGVQELVLKVEIVDFVQHQEQCESTCSQKQVVAIICD
jgi:hypothetical protein